MKAVKEKIKLMYIVALRFIRKIFFVIPIKQNRVIFESFSGDAYNCNPKYISEKLHESYGDKAEIVWAVKDESSVPEYVKSCRYRSFKHFIYRITSKVYVCNFLQAVEIPKRKGQTEIQTWHGGGCYKQVRSVEKSGDTAYEARRDLHIKETDYFITSSKYWEDEVMRNQFGYKGKALEIGMPRNDCLVGKANPEKIKSIRKKAGIDEDAYAVLYAPTWREGLDKFESLDYKKIQAAFSERFGKKCQMIFRAHIYGKEEADDVLNLTAYPDMQELLYACDALITDYSSSMWDFSLTKKPCFLYVPDLQRYTEQRGFDRDIHTWGFPVCETNEDFASAIKNFDEESFARAMENHQNELGTFEHGNASEKAAALIADLCFLNT